MKLFFVGVSMLALNTGTAQKWTDPYYTAPLSYEAGMSLGVMNGKHDIGKDLNYQNTKFSYGIYAAAFYEEKFGFRLEYNHGVIEGWDANLPLDPSLKRLRNLNFKTKINEVCFMLELQPMNWWKLYKGDLRDLSPYFTIGVGAFRFDPTTQFQNSTVRLQPLRIDGRGFDEYPDRKQYKLTQPCFPVGIGVKYDPTHDLTFRFEFLYRFLTTDYLDDVSHARTDRSLYAKYLPAKDASLADKLYHRGWELDPTYKPTGPRGNQGRDAYFTLQLKVSWMIERDWLW